MAVALVKIRSRRHDNPEIARGEELPLPILRLLRQGWVSFPISSPRDGFYCKESYLPPYIGMAQNQFEDVTVKIVTIETGAGHTNAVLSGQAFAFIGGPEHWAYAKLKGAELRAVVNGFLFSASSRIISGRRYGRLVAVSFVERKYGNSTWNHPYSSLRENWRATPSQYNRGDAKTPSRLPRQHASRG